MSALEGNRTCKSRCYLIIVIESRNECCYGSSVILLVIYVVKSAVCILVLAYAKCVGCVKVVRCDTFDFYIILIALSNGGKNLCGIAVVAVVEVNIEYIIGNFLAGSNCKVVTDCSFRLKYKGNCLVSKSFGKSTACRCCCYARISDCGYVSGHGLACKVCLCCSAVYFKSKSERFKLFVICRTGNFAVGCGSIVCYVIYYRV